LEVAVDVEQLRFTTSDWDQPQSVVMRGVDDALTDGDQLARVTLTGSGGAGKYAGLQRYFTLQNRDDDVLVLDKTSCSTGESAAAPACLVQVRDRATALPKRTNSLPRAGERPSDRPS
jgi:hypothetical protein